jgi:hypothetical protein
MPQRGVRPTPGGPGGGFGSPGQMPTPGYDGATGRPRYPGRPGPYGADGYYTYGYPQPAYTQGVPFGDGAEPIEEPWAEPWGGLEPTPGGAAGSSGRWIRRGRKIVLLGV